MVAKHDPIDLDDVVLLLDDVIHVEDLSQAWPWWLVRPEELAARYEWNPGRIHDAFNASDLAAWQRDLVLGALVTCDR